ncbi:hypothetical protein SK128_018428, partial [Halocaridina rubra]
NGHSTCARSDDSDRNITQEGSSPPEGKPNSPRVAMHLGGLEYHLGVGGVINVGGATSMGGATNVSANCVGVGGNKAHINSGHAHEMSGGITSVGGSCVGVGGDKAHLRSTHAFEMSFSKGLPSLFGSFHSVPPTITPSAFRPLFPRPFHHPLALQPNALARTHPTWLP